MLYDKRKVEKSIYSVLIARLLGNGVMILVLCLTSSREGGLSGVGEKKNIRVLVWVWWGLKMVLDQSPEHSTHA